MKKAEKIDTSDAQLKNNLKPSFHGQLSTVIGQPKNRKRKTENNF